MRAHQAEFRIATMARVLGVSPSGYYAWRKRERSAREHSDEALSTRRWGRHKGTSAHQSLTGQRVDDWLTLLGYPPSPALA